MSGEDRGSAGQHRSEPHLDGASPMRLVSQRVAPARLALNQITVNHADTAIVVEACAAAGIRHIGLWRHKVAETGVAEAAARVSEAGLSVSSLSRGGFFPAADAASRKARIDDTRRAVTEAAELGTGLLTLVCGGLPPDSRDLNGAREMVAEGIAAVVEDAAACGVRLGIEPLHPMYAAERSVVTTLDEALALAEPFAREHVGVVVDAFHLWWDPDMAAAVARAGDRIAGVQVCDWLVPLPDMVLGRGLPGTGVIDLAAFREATDAAGYTGPIEVEVLNREVWDRPTVEVVEEVVSRYRRWVALSA